MTRRQFITAAAVASVGAAGGYSLYSVSEGKAEYRRAVQQTWRHSQGEMATPPLLMRELVRYATLAPSSHNTQCWKFRVADRSISILPDFSRRCPVVDPDDHHLFVSLGCAAENLIQAAAAHGLKGEGVFRRGPDESIEISLTPGVAVRSRLFEAMPFRQSTRVDFDAKPLSTEDLRLLEAAGTGNGVHVHLFTDKDRMERILEFVIDGNSAQMRDPAFVRELKVWLRFSGGHAAKSGDGLFSGSSGNPTVPDWLGRLMFDFFFTEKAENDKYARHVRSSAGIAVFVSDVDDKAHWTEAGRAFERFALQATALGVRNAHLNQPVEVATLRQQFTQSLGITGGRPDLVVRFGRGPEMPRSLRRPVEAVLI